jgi:hypothetical protein
LRPFPAPTLTFLARWNLSSLEQRSDLLRFLRRDAERFPDLAEAVHERMTVRPLGQVAAWIARLADDSGARSVDAEALALIMVESLSAYWLMRATLGRVPGDLDDERFIATWVELVLAYAGRARHRRLQRGQLTPPVAGALLSSRCPRQTGPGAAG